MQLHSTCLLNELIFNQKLLSLIISCAINIHFNSADETPSCVLPPDSQPPPPKGNSFPSGLYASLRGSSSYYSLLLMFRIHLISLLTDCSNEIIDFTGERMVRGEWAGKSRQHSPQTTWSRGWGSSRQEGRDVASSPTLSHHCSSRSWASFGSSLSL